MIQEVNISLHHNEHQQICGFEGPEKKLEIDFKRNAQDSQGLRAIERAEWDDLLEIAKCTIISKTSNEFFDSYVLSESSLFVYPYKVILKTCGTTRLLEAISRLIELARSCGTKVEFVAYSRKNFNFPQRQPHPHSSFDSEVRYLDQFFQGHAYTLGPLTGDHWNLYIADYKSQSEFNSKPGREQTFEVMMSDLDQTVMNQFFRNDDFISAKHTSESSGISSILPGTEIDEFQFEPCGYSMNGLRGETYSTIHITPEKGFSYVSYETNAPVHDYHSLLQRVVNTFKPGRFCAVIFLDENSPAFAAALKQGDKTNFESGRSFLNFLQNDPLKGYSVECSNFLQFGKEADYCVAFCNFVKEEFTN